MVSLALSQAQQRRLAEFVAALRSGRADGDATT
jgi:hypothetical protein